jgi:hypothetical protein
MNRVLLMLVWDFRGICTYEGKSLNNRHFVITVLPSNGCITRHSFSVLGRHLGNCWARMHVDCNTALTFWHRSFTLKF